ncbi:MAG: L,D-transpeptidase [Anaerolineales bacterium]|nr:L,D-transpeptidase [Anaerolineales bacterium]
MTTRRITRRNFLKSTGLAAGGLLLPPAPPDGLVRTQTGLGRAVRGLYVYSEPSFESERLNFLAGDSVFELYGDVQSPDDLLNKRWHRVRRGFVHSGPVQPVGWHTQAPSTDLPATGALVEVSVPVAPARAGAGPGFRETARFYYGTTHWVQQIATDDTGAVWYGILGDLTRTYSWVDGRQLRRVTAEEIAPISPEVSDKRIEITLGDQMLRAYEGNTVVLEQIASCGTALRREGNRTIYSTPTGDHQVISKRPSRHMAGGDLASADGYDLPGVPWVTYIHWWGVAIHGTFWHDDFGIPRSHGCINLPNEVAKWVYRWTTPAVPLADRWLDAKGTVVIVRD